MSKNQLTLGYWNIFGVVQPARFLLELTKTPYNDIRYSESDKWFKQDKLNLGLDLPNLPYLIDGDLKLTEFVAIFDYLSEKYGNPEWLGKDNDKYVVQSLRSLLGELPRLHHKGNIQPTNEEKIKYISENITPKYRYIAKFIGQKEYLLGYFTVADLYFLSTIKHFKSTYDQALVKDIYDEFAPIFDPILERISLIPEIAAYIASDRYPKK